MSVLPFGINRVEDSQAKREAIQARQTLYNDGVKAYRAERRGAWVSEVPRESGEASRSPGWARTGGRSIPLDAGNFRGLKMEIWA